MDFEQISNKQQKLLVNFGKLSGVLSQSQKDYVVKQKELEIAQERISLEPEIKSALEKFQQQEHKKLVGANEVLLTALLQDVIKTDNDERQVVLNIFNDRGNPALDILIDKNNQGKFENPYSGSGGAVSNVLSLGLRAIALIQSKQRRFLVLDEPDCWVGEGIVEDFIEVIKQLSVQLGIQILVISHKPAFFNGIEHSLFLKKEDGFISAESIKGDLFYEWEEGQEGIRFIALKNFQAHTNTLIPLSPYVTLITGVNDLGKSAIVSSLRAVFYGEAFDSDIKHGEEESEVVIDFGDKSLLWRRKLKGTPKETFILCDHEHGLENPLRKTDSARNAPEWVKEETGIGFIEGFDIQLGHQKQPVFLLNEPPSKRAKALVIGDENGYLNKMVEISKAELAKAKSDAKSRKAELDRLYEILRVFDAKKLFLEEFEKQLADYCDSVKSVIKDNETMISLLAELSVLNEKQLSLNKIINNGKLKETKFDFNEVSLLEIEFVKELFYKRAKNETLEKISSIFNKQEDSSAMKKSLQDLDVSATKFIELKRLVKNLELSFKRNKAYRVLKRLGLEEQGKDSCLNGAFKKAEEVAVDIKETVLNFKHLLLACSKNTHLNKIVKKVLEKRKALGYSSNQSEAETLLTYIEYLQNVAELKRGLIGSSDLILRIGQVKKLRQLLEEELKDKMGERCPLCGRD